MVGDQIGLSEEEKKKREAATEHAYKEGLWAPIPVTGQRARQMRVVPAEVLKRLYARDDTKGLIQTGGASRAAGPRRLAGALTRGTWWVLPALLLQGIFINALFGAMHESVHYGSFKTRWMADLLAFFSGAAILNNAGFYRHYHLAHHRYTQDPERDPELITSGTPGPGAPISFASARSRS